MKTPKHSLRKIVSILNNPDEDGAYLDKHLIPKDPAIWKLDKFEEFVAARRKLILDKFKFLLASTSTVAAKL